jgi:hypothetical protein
MRTTEVFVEQVIVGMLVLATAVLPFLRPDALLGALSVGDGVALLGIAYLLGILFDRFGDTLSYGLEQRGRLAFAARLGPDERKRFHEDALCVRAAGAGNGVGQRLEYLRARTRLSRALAVFLPATTTAASLHLVKELAPAWASVSAVVVVALYALGMRAVLARKLPRTEEVEGYVSVGTGEILPGHRVFRDPSLAYGAAVLLVGAAAAAWSRTPAAATALAVGTLLTLLAGWTFLRVRRTFMRLLLDVDAYSSSVRGGAGATGEAGRDDLESAP